MYGLKALSSTLNRVQQPDIFYEPALCSRTRWRHSHCSLCQEGCAPGALQLTNQIDLNESKCTGCGLCISRCPNGVFWSRRRDDAALIRQIAGLLSSSTRKTIEFDCGRSGQVGQDVLTLPCLGRLTENLILAPLVLGANLVEIHWPECRGCANENCLSHLRSVLLLVTKLTTMVGLGEDVVQVRRSGQYSEHMPDISPCFSRRHFLRDLTREAGQALVTLLPEFASEKPSGTLRHVVGAKRLILLKLIGTFPQHTPIRIERKGLPVAEVEIHSGCVGCPVCATLCPTGALERTENAEGVNICFHPEICTACHICQEACMLRVISTSPEFRLESLYERNTKLLCRLTARICQNCGDSFWGDAESNLCGYCRMKQRMAHPDLHKDFPRGREQT